MASVLDLNMSHQYAKRGDSVRNLQEPKHITGVGVNREFINRMKALQVYDHIVFGYPCMLPFRDASFEIVLATDAVNPLNKRDAWALVDECKRVATEKFYASITYPTFAVFVVLIKAKKCEMISIS